MTRDKTFTEQILCSGKRVKIFLSQIKINNSEVIDVEERTRGQSSNPEKI